MYPTIESPEGQRLEKEYEEFLRSQELEENTAAAGYIDNFSTPYQRFTDVFEAAERLSGNHPYGTNNQKAFYPNTVRQAFNIINGETDGKFPEDREYLRYAAILLSAIPKSPGCPTVYRGAYPFEGPLPEVGQEFDLPLAKFTISQTQAIQESHGIILEMGSPVPWIQTEPNTPGTPREGFISGRFKVSFVYRYENFDLTLIRVLPVSNYEELAETVLRNNGWDYGDDLQALTAAATLQLPRLDHEIYLYFNGLQKFFSPKPKELPPPEPEEENDKLPFVKELNFVKVFLAPLLHPFANECHDPETGRFCEVPVKAGNPKLDRWAPENVRQAKALQKLKDIPTEGKQTVDGKKVKDAIKGSAPAEPEIRNQFTEEEVQQLPKTKETVNTNDIIATKTLLNRSDVAAVIHGIDEPNGPWHRPGYLPIAIRQNGKLYLWDGHHRLEGARILGHPTTEVEVVTPRKKSLKASADTEFANQCHDPNTGEFCETHSPKDWATDLTDEERKAVVEYTFAGYEGINRAAVEGTENQNVTLIDSALAKFPKRTKPITLYRETGFKNDEAREAALSNYEIGSEVSLTRGGAFQSTSSTMRHPLARSGPYSVIFKITAKTGADLTNAYAEGSGVIKEKEILIPRHTRFKVTKVEKGVQFKTGYKSIMGPADYIVIHVEEVE